VTAMLETYPTDAADMDTRTTDTAAEAIDRAWAAAERVTDPEMPMLTLLDLGVLRDVTIEERPRRHHHHPDLFGLPGDGDDAR
jgi:ring-1,2-phenylacetyl-CoA epoxidase subunit PaaD